MRGSWSALALGLSLLAGPRVVWADSVDDAYARGNQAAAQQRWSDAVAAYEEAARLLPEPNAVLSYNLGTAHAHQGDLGRATFYLRRALDERSAPTADVAELARANLAEVRRRAEIAATAHDAQIDRPAGWWDVLLEGLREPWIGWASLLAGVSFLLVWFLERRRVRNRGPLQATLVVLAVLYVVVGGLRALALRADAIAPAAVVLGDRVEARERPGAHADASFVVQGGARVRIVDRSPGWRQVRLPGGLSGWLPERQVGDLSQIRALAAPSPARKTGDGDPDAGS